MMKRNRPYDGQSHTDAGIRGATEISGITFRDLKDAFIRAVCLSNGVDHPEAYKQAELGEDAEITPEMFWAATEGLHLMAVQQNMSCEIEKLMGIFPNIPGKGKSFDELMIGIPIVEMEDLADEIKKL